MSSVPAGLWILGIHRCIAEGANEDFAFSFNCGPSVRLVKIESDRPCKAQYFTHPQNGKRLAAYRDFSTVTVQNSLAGNKIVKEIASET
jgi:hypothetical protein